MSILTELIGLTDDQRINGYCLELAIREAEAAGDMVPAESIVERARAYRDFLFGTRDAEVIDAARDFAKRVGG